MSRQPYQPALRPQSLVITFCGAYVVGQRAVSTGSFVEALERIGVNADATRSALTRMTRTGLLELSRSGRNAYYAVTERAGAILSEGARRVWEHGVILRDWRGQWTLLGFSLPESRRADRHLVRSRLAWAGFGMIQHGLWISPHTVDPDALFEGLDVVDNVKAFTATPFEFMDVGRMIADAWDVAALAERYRSFLARWDVPEPLPEVPDDLGRQLLLSTEWLLLVREDPRLPVEHLPEAWPGFAAQDVARRLRARFAGPAQEIAAEFVHRLP